jgi:hypothetical protein
VEEVNVGRGDNFYDVVIDVDNGDTDQLKRIIQIEMPKWLELFSERNREYGSNKRSLGPKGEFVEINRKVGKLEIALWDGHPERLTSEKVDEVLQDIIGHCFLALDMLSQGE